MAAYNHLTLVGNLTRDPEVKYLQNGTAVCELGLAINEKTKNASGEWVESAIFVDVTCWQKDAENAAKYLSKGSSILVDGRLKMDTWTDRTGGEKRSKLKVTANGITFISGGKGNGGGAPAGGSTPPAARAPAAPTPPPAPPADDSLIPF